MRVMRCKTSRYYLIKKSKILLLFVILFVYKYEDLIVQKNVVYIVITSYY